MATNEILRFAETNTGTNLLTQAEYLADSQRPIGNQPGVARSKLVNKALRQASLIAAGLAEYIADNQANNVTDALTPQNIADYLQAAITGALGVTPPQFDNDTSLATTAFVRRELLGLGNAVYGAIFGKSFAAPGYQKLPSGLIIQWGAGTSSGAAAGNGVVTFPVAYPVACLFAGAFISSIGIASAQTTQTGTLGTSGNAFSILQDGAFASGIGYRWIAIGS